MDAGEDEPFESIWFESPMITCSNGNLIGVHRTRKKNAQGLRQKIEKSTRVSEER